MREINRKRKECLKDIDCLIFEGKYLNGNRKEYYFDDKLEFEREYLL